MQGQLTTQYHKYTYTHQNVEQKSKKISLYFLTKSKKTVDRITSGA